ncbi:RHS repeat-associated core domain-containing protein [Streptomyces sp. NPDC001903]|uniref:RHS repeat-associated core domain-containing protein n=1 Tax=Streptomyces sp. NPDC001903 TaxID=3364622 RepID=UPI003691BDCA
MSPGAAVAAQAGNRVPLPELKQPRAVPVTALKSGGKKRPDAAAGSLKPKTAWPAPGTAQVPLERGGRAGSLPVTVTPDTHRPAPKGLGVAAARPAGGAAKVSVADRATARKAGVDGLLLSVARPGGSLVDNVPVTVEVAYDGFRNAYGGDWAARLRLVRMPSCALTTPERPECRTQTPLRTTNDVKGGKLAAGIGLAPAAMVLAATAEAAGPTGDYKATSLQPSGSWSAGGSTGGFSWTYPISVPQVPGGPQPSVSLGYSSQSVDGLTAATNSQPSWIGDGWSWEPGYIERKYKGCEDDKSGGTNTTKVGDLCWYNDNATLNLGGKTTELVYENGKGWHPASDSGEKVEKLTGAANGDQGTAGVDGVGEHWKVTGTDGTQYFFGLNRLPGWKDASTPTTNSTWTVPVFGNQAGEPCYNASFAGGWCNQAWRWQLDHVIAPGGAAMAYYWKQETNNYGRNVSQDGKATVTRYIRGGWLDRIDYGLRSDAVYGGKPMGQVVFGVDERCLQNCGTFDEANAKNWPDVPFDQFCKDGSTECKDQFSPTFWSRMRLKSITTKVLTGGVHKDVDTWTLDQSFPPAGDGISTPMWLKSVQHTGKAGGTVALPAVTFAGEQKANRVDKTGDGLAPFVRLRMSQITTETGGTTGIYYSPQDCTPTTLPKPDQTNTTRCYPVKWAFEGETAQLDWFNTYVVTQVVEGDNLAASPDKVTSYSYLDGAAWAKNEDEFAKAEDRVHSVNRGYGRVQTRTGAASDPRSLSETRYFRGIDGAAVNDSAGAAVTDRPEFAGQVRETATYNGDDTNKLVTATSSVPWRSPPVATRNRPGLPALVSYRTGTEKESTRTTVSGGVRTTETSRTFDAYGMTATESFTGDKDKTGDEQCVTTDYARNTATGMVDRVARIETVAVPCGSAVSRPGDVINDVRTFYDGGALGTVPGTGLITKTDRINGKGDGYDVITSVPSTCGADGKQLCYDAHGRQTAAADAYGKVTRTGYTPASGEVAASVAVTNPKGHVETTVLDPLRSQPTQVTDANGKITTTAYDALGRVAKVWLPTRSATTYPDSPNHVFEYTVRNDGPVVTTTKTLGHDSTYRTAYAFSDGLLRGRQTQEPSPDGSGRLVTETFYDTRGLPWRSSGTFYATGAAEPVLVTGQELKYPASTDTEYDGAGRPTAVIGKRFGDETKRTTTTYTGDTTTVVPPQGGTATTTTVDALGRTVAHKQYTAADRSAGQTSTYAYDKRGRVATTTDPSGVPWTYTYDVRGRLLGLQDPDKGASSYVYDQGDRLTDVTDGSQTTLHTDYDELGRKTALKKGATLLAEWTYDTATNGKGRSAKAVRWINGQAYENATTSYNSLYQPVLQQVTVPAAEGALAGTYKWTNSYNLNTGQVMWVQHPAAGGLPSEKVANTYTAGAGLLGTVGAGVDPIVSANTYDHYGRNTRQEYGDFARHVWVSREYDEHTGSVTRSYLDRETAPQRIEDARYAYDPAGNITSIASAFGQDAGRTTDTQCFKQDALRRVTEAWTNTGESCAAAPAASVVGGPDAYWTSYTYDAVGNRKTETKHKTASGPAADTVRTYADPGAGKHNLPKVTQTGTDPHEEVFTYDAAGNTETRKIGPAAQQTLKWDDEGHLASVVQGTKTSSYLYDAEGGRLLRKDSTGTTLYLPGGNELKLDKAGTTVTGTRYYSVAGQTVALRTGGKLTFVFNDHHGTGSTQVSADAAQTVVRRKTGIFGEARGTQPAAWTGEKGFVGGTKDGDTGLTHLGAREYDPAIGRFVSVDPIMDLADPQQQHGYTYSNNNPVNLSDPDGLKPTECMEAGYICRYTSNGWDVDTKDHSGKPFEKTLTHAEEDHAQQQVRLSQKLAHKQRERRFFEIWVLEKFEVGEGLDDMRDANKHYCRDTKFACAWSNYTQENGIDFFGVELTEGMDDHIKKILSRIDESWTWAGQEPKGKDVPLAFNDQEFEIAWKLAEEGHHVVARGEGRTPDRWAPGGVGSFDAWVDGIRTEFKDLSPQGKNARNSIVKEIQSGWTQGADAVIVRLRDHDEDMARSAVNSVRVSKQKPTGLTSVRIIGDDYDFTEDLR